MLTRDPRLYGGDTALLGNHIGDFNTVLRIPIGCYKRNAGYTGGFL